MKTAKIILESIKDPDGWNELIRALGLKYDSETRRKHFEFGEYASIEIEVAEDMRIVGGRILPIGTRQF